jgi:hypothetical protein
MLKKFFVEKPIGKTPFGRPKCRWEDNNKMDLRKKYGERVLAGRVL